MAIILFIFMTDANIFSENALLYYFRRQFFLFQSEILSHIGNTETAPFTYQNIPILIIIS
jgi:putative heme iron utilization protein